MISRAHHPHLGAYLAVVDEDSFSVLYEDASFVDNADETDVALEWFDIDVGARVRIQPNAYTLGRAHYLLH